MTQILLTSTLGKILLGLWQAIA